MVLVLEALVGAYKVELVRILLTEPRQDTDLDLTLASVRRVVLEDLDCDDLVRTLLPTFHHLPKGAASEELQHLILIGHGVEHLMLHQLVVAVGTAGRACVSAKQLLTSTILPRCATTVTRYDSA